MEEAYWSGFHSRDSVDPLSFRRTRQASGHVPGADKLRSALTANVAKKDVLSALLSFTTIVPCPGAISVTVDPVTEAHSPSANVRRPNQDASRRNLGPLSLLSRP